MVTPLEVRTAQTVAFLRQALEGRDRVLEVGCGNGRVARALGASGFSMTALDARLGEMPSATRVTYVEQDFLAFEDRPFDAVVFTSSLHHLAPLDQAIARAAELLVPDGLFVADDFDLDAPDAATLRWYYDTQELLIAAELYDHDHLDAPHPDPVTRWQQAHAHDPPLHSGVQMRGAIAARLAIRDVQPAAYLYRYITKSLPNDSRGGAIAQHLRATEERGIAEGTLLSVGLRIVAALA